MNRYILAWVASAALLGAAGAAPAMADDSGATQALGQSGANQQSADSNATSTQVAPSNQNISVRVLSPGNNGPVSQTNSSRALSAAGNLNKTSQSASQTQGGGGTQAADQTAASQQSADADASSKQEHPSNQNIDVRVLSPGDNGSVSQANTSQADALAGTLNKTTQDASQDQGASHPLSGDRCRSSCAGGATGIQALGQTAVNRQDADADASSTQIHPSNVNAPVRVLSPGDDGKVEQANVSSAEALAGNANKTEQSAEQSQGGGHESAAPRCDRGCGDQSDATAIQALGQAAYSDQKAGADATSEQTGASNVNAPVRVGSEGDGGSAQQVNASGAEALALNLSDTGQSAEQEQGGRGLGTAIQALGQEAGNKQHADADATSEQICPVNLNAPVYEAIQDRRKKSKSPKAPTGGSVMQANLSSAASAAANANRVTQWGSQHQ